MKPINGCPGLPEVAKAYGFPIVRQSGGFASRMCPRCGESTESSNKLSIYEGRDEKWRCHCFACHFTGDVIDFVAAHERTTLAEAIKLLDGKARSVHKVALNSLPKVSHKGTRRESDAEAIRAIWDAAKKWRSGDTLSNLEERAIPRRIIEQAVDLGLIAALPRDPERANDVLFKDLGPDLMVRAKLLRDPGKKWSAAAFRPLVGLLGSAVQFGALKESDNVFDTRQGPRYMLYGEVKWPYVYRTRPGAVFAVVEGLVDVLSLSAHDEYSSSIDAIIGIPGTGHWQPEWLGQILSKYSDAELLVGLDNDDAGNNVANGVVDADGNVITKGIIGEALDLGIRAERILPASGKDWNESLMARSQVKKRSWWPWRIKS